jgi:hypothetical protein
MIFVYRRPKSTSNHLNCAVFFEVYAIDDIRRPERSLVERESAVVEGVEIFARYVDCSFFGRNIWLAAPVFSASRFGYLSVSGFKFSKDRQSSLLLTNDPQQHFAFLERFESRVYTCVSSQSLAAMVIAGSPLVDRSDFLYAYLGEKEVDAVAWVSFSFVHRAESIASAAPVVIASTVGSDHRERLHLQKRHDALTFRDWLVSMPTRGNDCGSVFFTISDTELSPDPSARAAMFNRLLVFFHSHWHCAGHI